MLRITKHPRNVQNQAQESTGRLSPVTRQNPKTMRFRSIPYNSTVEDIVGTGIVVSVVVLEREGAWSASRESANDLTSGVVARRGACIQGKGL